MSISIAHSSSVLKGEIHLTPSKSESNRALIIRALCSDNFSIENLSKSNDTEILQALLTSDCKELSVNLAGTTMRFLTAYFAIQPNQVLLTGAQRMQERPIKILVDALNQLGADISYANKIGYPPLKINGKKLFGDRVKINGGVSSQYTSALLMIAPTLQNGLVFEFEGNVISKPYITMTVEMMRYFGVTIQWERNLIFVKPARYVPKSYKIEADWSAASYWYSMVALSKQADVTLFGLKQNSLQGDSLVQEIYKLFGVSTQFVDGGIRLTKVSGFKPKTVEIDFIDIPDIAQTVAVTCAALNVEAKLTGLKTLRIKETDRIYALQTELTKLGFSVAVENDTILIHAISKSQKNYNPLKTYNDHRMAMAFAPLSLQNSITINDETVIEKSYPNFWDDMKIVGFKIYR